MKGRKSGQIRAQAIAEASGLVLRRFVRQHALPGTELYTDGHGAYTLLEGEYRHRAVQHSVGIYVIGQAHTNGIESFWSMLKRGYYGTYHRMSPKHLDRYVTEFVGRGSIRNLNTIDRMSALAQGMVGKRLTYQELVA